MNKETTLTVEDGVRTVTHYDENGEPTDQVVELLTEERYPLRLDRSHEWVAPREYYMRPVRGQYVGRRRLPIPRQWEAVVDAATHKPVAYVRKP
jgi:hypothetical protein